MGRMQALVAARQASTHRNSRGLMSELVRLSDIIAIERLNTNFGHELDRGDADGFVALFTPDALYTHGPRISRGREEIRAFYLSRTANGPRTSRHFATGLKITFTGPHEARGVSVCTTWAAAADPPIPSTLPVLVADFEDIYAFDGERWRFRERHIRPIFTAAPGVPR